jgi:hypothetical protein
MPEIKGFKLENILKKYLMQFNVHLGSSKTMVQFITIFHLWSHGTPMSKFETIKELFCILKLLKKP